MLLRKTSKGNTIDIEIQKKFSKKKKKYRFL